jgi:hypothetical protein
MQHVFGTFAHELVFGQGQLAFAFRVLVEIGVCCLEFGLQLAFHLPTD